MKRSFLGIGPPKIGAQNYLFLTISQLNGNFEGQYLQRGTCYEQSGKGIGNYKGSPTSLQNFVNFGPLAAKNRTVVFAHPPKSTSAWQRRPSRWPALRRANISSLAGNFVKITVIIRLHNNRQ